MNRPLPLSRRAAWIGILLLSPLAYLGSFALARILPSRNSVITLTHERAIQTAVAFARTRGFAAQDWNVKAGARQYKEIAVVLAHVRPPALDQVTAASVANVRLESPSSGEWMRVIMTPTGRIVGFSSSEPKLPASVDDPAAERIATTYLRDFLGPESQFELPAPKVRLVETKKQHRIFDWSATVPGFTAGQAAFQVETVGDRVTRENCEVTVSPDFLRTLRPAQRLKEIIGFLAGIYFLAILIFAIVRYARRTAEREVSHRRTILVTAVFLVSSSLFLFFGPDLNVSVNGAPPTPQQRVVVLGFTVLFFGLIGLGCGVAYGAGEGDVRAAYPGKLTSLDALLCGKVFSASVARSILVGGAFAGAMLLVQNVALLVAHGWRPVDDHDILSSVVSDMPLGQALSDTWLNALCIAGWGLLLPIAMLRPRVRKQWLFYLLVPLFSMLSATAFAADLFSWRNALITGSVSVAVVCVTFFYGDLLASISGIVALDIVTKLSYRGASSPYFAESTSSVLYVGIGFLLVQVYFAWRGRTYEESEVRPLYARLLAEHLSLRAEIGAARLAQLRLLPDAAPQIAGLSIAGSCVPARDVGGDFYDFYPLDDHRVGVFMAEGGNRELASAMPIALAKGYLLYTSRLDLSPVEVLRRLRELLGETLHREGASVSMLYAVIDSRAATVRFARTGNSPRLAINGCRAPEEVAAAIHHGAAALTAHDSLVIYTDGLTTQIREGKRQAVDEFLAQTAANLRDGSAEGLHSAILKAAIRRKNEPPPDDVTAVVIRLQESDQRALEVVA